MLVESPWHSLTSSGQSYDERGQQHALLKHKAPPSSNTARAYHPDYPSPPMSNPPSPARQPPELLNPGSTSGLQQVATTTSAPQLPPGTQAFYGQSAIPSTSSGTPSSFPPFTQASSQPQPSPATRSTGLGIPSFTAPQYGYASSSTATADPSSARGGRKSKAHVASACVNCKRAHLSCDVQRPCARCVASGKQDSCFDVAHKKRGRPRLRDEGDFRFERNVPPSSHEHMTGPSMTTPTRPIAATRQRRAESFRSIQSMTSEGSSTYGPPTPRFGQPPPPFQAALTYQQPAPPPGMIPQIPTAFLDLDFKILRVNRSFQQIMSGGRNLSGLRLTDIAAPADTESFQSIRNRIRQEREARDPAYLPPILSTGEDPLGGVTEANVDQFTQGFSDHTYTWTQMQAGPGGPQVFPARVRLARAGTYFTVITLPSFRPAEFPPPIQLPYGQPLGMPFALGPPLHPQESYNPQQRQIMPASAPPSMYPYESAGVLMQQQTGQRRMSRTYPSPQPSAALQPHQQQQYQPSYQSQPQPPPQPPPQPQQYPPYQGFAPQRQPVSEPPSQIPQHAPGTAQRDPGLPMGVGMQLPPIGASSPMEIATGPAIGQYGETPTGQRSSSSEGSQGRRVRSPKKRRRMGIDEVLQ